MDRRSASCPRSQSRTSGRGRASTFVTGSALMKNASLQMRITLHLLLLLAAIGGGLGLGFALRARRAADMAPRTPAASSSDTRTQGQAASNRPLSRLTL